MSATVTMTELERDDLARQLWNAFGYRKCLDNSYLKDIREAEQNWGRDDKKPEYWAAFQAAIDVHCPEFDPQDILDAAFDLLDDPQPKDLRDEGALARTRAYRAGRNKNTSDRVKAEIDDVHRVIGQDVNWMARHGALFFVDGTYPILAYALALDLNFGDVDPAFVERLAEAAVAYNEQHPDYLRCLARHFADFEFRSIRYGELVEKIDEATTLLARKKSEPEDD